MLDQSLCYPIMGWCFSNRIDLALIVTILIFMLGIFYNSYRKREKQSHVRQRYLFALKAEIALNISGLQSTIAAFPSPDIFRQFLRADPKNRPFITLSYSVIFRNRTEILQDLPDLLINNIVEFYGKLESLALNVVSIEEKAFERISDDGREAVLQYILEIMKSATQQGDSILIAIELHLKPRKRFRFAL
jgi:hypothetical protein